MAIASPRVTSQFTYVQEWNATFLSLFPHRFDYIVAPHPQPGEKPVWRTESRHPLSDRIITQGSHLFGVRFGPETRYCVLDIDIGSAYHPRQDPFALSKLLGSLEPLGLVTPVICTSSDSGGLHVYFPFSKAQRSWKLASALATLIEAKGFKLKSGQLELFPNTKHYTATGSPSLFNAHRLPLQTPGSYLLNGDCEPIWSDQGTFVEHWQRAIQRNDLSQVKIRQVLAQQKRTRHVISEKADKFLNDLNAEVEPGWTGKGQTNRLLGRITMRCFIFHHIIAGGDPLSGQRLIDEIIATAQSLPGYRTWCRHQHEIGKRVTDWVRCIENSHYFPYGTQQGKYKAPAAIQAKPTSNWNQEQAIATQTKIKAEVQRLKRSNQFPAQITQRFQQLTQAGISGSSLYRYKELWHPTFERNKTLHLCEHQLTRPQGAVNWHNPTSLLCQNGCNQSERKDLSQDEQTKNLLIGCNAPQSKDLETTQPLSKEEAIAQIKALLVHASAQPARTAPEAAEALLSRQKEIAQQQQTNYLARLQSYLCSGEVILVMEALDVLSVQPDYLATAGMAKALEAALEGTEMPERPACLARLLKHFADLGWHGHFIQQALRRCWGRSNFAELDLSELRSWHRIQLADS